MAQSNSLPEELLPLLIARIRVGTALVATSIVLYGALELWLQRAPLGSFFAVKAVQVAAVAIVWIALARIRTDGWRVAVGLALALVVEVCVTLVVSGILAGDVASAPLLFILVTLGTATLLPWGVAASRDRRGRGASLLVNAWLVPCPTASGYQAIAAAMTFVAASSPYQLEMHRRQRHRRSAGAPARARSARRSSSPGDGARARELCRLRHPAGARDALPARAPPASAATPATRSRAIRTTRPRSSPSRPTATASGRRDARSAFPTSASRACSTDSTVTSPSSCRTRPACCRWTAARASTRPSSPAAT
jgi:hypothetical protein